MAQKLANTGHHVALEEHYDSVIATFISDVRQSPTDIIENLLSISEFQNSTKGRDSSSNFLEFDGRFSFAQIG